jgi:hypothetical protein
MEHFIFSYLSHVCIDLTYHLLVISLQNFGHTYSLLSREAHVPFIKNRRS